MVNLFIYPFEHELVSALAIVSRIPFNDSEGTVKCIKESGIYWFESNNGQNLYPSRKRRLYLQGFSISANLIGRAGDSDSRNGTSLRSGMPWQ